MVKTAESVASGMTLRPYQRMVVDQVKDSFARRDGFVLIQAATGAGKTIVFCQLIRELLEETPYLRIGVLAHRRELVSQARDKMLSVWPNCSIGIACHSLQKASELKESITIGTIQTLSNQSHVAPFNIIIVDEVHRLPPKDQESQFGDFLKSMLERNPGLQVLGVTATPFRMGHGYIFGQYCRTPWANWFSSLSLAIRVDDLQEQGFLAPYQYMVSDGEIVRDLEGLRLGSGGDYATDALEGVVVRHQHLMSAVKTVQAQASDRQAILIFCVSIAHADRLAEAFSEEGMSSASIHSGLSITERDRLLEGFDRGEIRILTNVNVLTEGWDSPRADCVLLCRPTLSTALYVQMVGRGLRTHVSKRDCLVLDLAGCFARHGSVRRPIVRIDGQALPLEGVEGKKDRACPGCEEIIPLSSFSCPYCERELKPEVVYVDDEQEMVSIDDEDDENVFCDACAKTYARRACAVEWHSYDLTSTMPGLLYCPDEHPLEPLRAIRPLDREGQFRVAHLNSRLKMESEDVALGISLLLLDDLNEAFLLELTFEENDREGIEAFISIFGESGLEGHDAIAMASEVKRKDWDFSGTFHVTRKESSWSFEKEEDLSLEVGRISQEVP